MKEEYKTFSKTTVDKRTGKKSILDHVHTNYSSKWSINLFDHCISDHRILVVDLTVPEGPKKQIYVTKIVDHNKIYKIVEQHLKNRDCNELTFKTLTDIIQPAIKESTTTSKRQTTRNIAEGWFTPEVWQMMKERDEAYKQMRTFPDAEQNIMSFKEINKQLKNIIKKKKKEYGKSIHSS
ncbi:hypothetical protein HHI36_000193 [Cryptolaemus montrouzieri]|uniref:Uncharacterized protein n=1 Tax=Cryptolaemus montrouzieri TaxID=559131 RepID=A0ABD2P3X1_9CUCU